jgi:hypothetical protein
LWVYIFPNILEIALQAVLKTPKKEQAPDKKLL